MRIKSKAFGISAPLGLAYVARYLESPSREIRILDNCVENLDEKKFKNYIVSFAPSIVGFTTHTFTIHSCFHLAGLIKKINPRIKIILGGPHATYLSRESLSNEHVDIVVAGEGEETMAEVVKALENKVSLKGIKGISYKETDGSVVDNGPREMILDLDSVPFPAYELLDMEKYYASVNRRFSNRKFGSILTSRGCPYQCTFCSHEMFGKRVRMRSPENVVDELEFLVRKYGIGEFIFLDDTFTINKERVIKICELILSRKLDIIWSCNTRADHASEELYNALRKAGCKSVHIGAESASQEMLDSMNKNISVGQITNSVRLAKKHVGHVVCGFIIGMPGDTVQRAVETIKFAKKLNPDYATFNIATPMPGSAIFREAVEKGLIKKNEADWSNFLELFSPDAPIVELSVISKKNLIRLAQKAFAEFYFRPGYIAERLSKLRSASELFGYFRGLRAIINYEFLNFNSKK